MRTSNPAHGAKDRPLHVAFGLVVRRTRQKRALSQEELGERSDLHRNHIGRIERGDLAPTLRTVETIAAALETAPSTLIAQAELEKAQAH